MKEIKARRMRFLAMLLGLIVFINVPAISAYAASVDFGSFHSGDFNWESYRGSHISAGETISWRVIGSNTYNFTVQYLRPDGSVLWNNNTSATVTSTGGNISYTVLRVDQMGVLPADQIAEPIGWILVSVTVDTYNVSQIVLKAYYGEPKDDGAGEPHVHQYKWEVTREATEDCAGEESYICECGSVLYVSPISAEGIFIKKTIEKIKKAPYGSTVVITTDRWLTFNSEVCEEFAKRPDLGMRINYREEGHKGPKLSTLIPKGTDLRKYLDDNGYVGFLCLRNNFTTIPNIPISDIITQ